MTASTAVGADFNTQWANLVARIRNLEGSLAVSNQPNLIATNPASNGTSNVPQLPTTYTGSGSEGYSTTIDPVTGKPFPIAPPIIIQQGILPVTDVVASPGAYLNSTYCDVTWDVSVYSNALQFDVLWGTANGDGTIAFGGSTRVGGDSFRITGLQPNTNYGVQIIASNILGQSQATPNGSYIWFTTTGDPTIPPAVGGVLVGSGATTVIVEFNPLTIEQAPDVANGAGVYDIQVTNDPTFATILREMRTSAYVVSFNDIFPSTTILTTITALTAPGTSINFGDLSQITPGAGFKILVDSEYISFNAASGNSAAISVRNSGTTPLANGPQAHAIGTTATFQFQTLWYARVAAIDTSGNQGPWSTSSGAVPAGSVTDSMLVGDLNAAHITFGVMQGDRIEVNSLQATTIKSSSITTANIGITGGSLTAGNPPTTGLVLNSQGLTLYTAGAQSVHLDAGTGAATFTGVVSGSTITGGTISGGTITGGTITGTNINGGTITGTNITIKTGIIEAYTGTGTGVGDTVVALTPTSPAGAGLVMYYSGALAGYLNAFYVGGAAVTLSTGDNTASLSMYSGIFSIIGRVISNNSASFAGTISSGGSPGFRGSITDGATSNFNAINCSDATASAYMQSPAFTVSSDKTLKKNVKNLPNGHNEALHSLRPVSFEYRSKKIPGKHMGFIAQELVPLFPELVGKDAISEKLTLNYTGLIAPIVQELQLLKNRLDKLEKAST